MNHRKDWYFIALAKNLDIKCFFWQKYIQIYFLKSYFFSFWFYPAFNLNLPHFCWNLYGFIPLFLDFILINRMHLSWWIRFIHLDKSDVFILINYPSPYWWNGCSYKDKTDTAILINYFNLSSEWSEFIW